MRLRFGRETKSWTAAWSRSVRTSVVEAAQSTISVCGSGDISARADESAEIVVMGSGDVSVIGGAKCSIRGSGSGEVACS